jgi:hypothetical protein
MCVIGYMIIETYTPTMYDHYTQDSLIDGKRQSVDIWDTVNRTPFIIVLRHLVLPSLRYVTTSLLCLFDNSQVKRIWTRFAHCVIQVHTYSYCVSLSQGIIHTP